MDAREWVGTVQRIPQIGDDIGDLLRKMSHIACHAWIGEGGSGERIAPRTTADPQVDTSGVQRLQHPKILGYFQSTIMGQHHSTTADSDRPRASRNLADKDFRTGAGEIPQIMML